MRLGARGRYVIYTFDRLDARPKPDAVDGVYAVAEFTHRLTDQLNHRLSAVHSFQTGIQSAITESTDVRLNVQYCMSSRTSLSANFLYSVDDRSGTGLREHYTLMGPSLAFSYRISERLRTNLGYQYRNRDPDLPRRSYDVNRISISATYRF